VVVGIAALAGKKEIVETSELLQLNTSAEFMVVWVMAYLLARGRCEG
jgi:hypothetical protein